MDGFWQQGSGLRKVMFGLGVAAVAGVLVRFVAMPTYQDYQTRNKVSEAIATIAMCRTEIARIVRTTSADLLSTSLFACDGGASSGGQIPRHLKSIAVRATGAMTITLDHRFLPELTLATSSVTVVPMLDAKSALRTTDVGKTVLAWRCGSPEDGTTIPGKYLPTDCSAK